DRLGRLAVQVEEFGHREASGEVGRPGRRPVDAQIVYRLTFSVSRTLTGKRIWSPMLLVTGATGHVGRELVRELDARGAAFRVLVRDPARAVGLPERAERVVGDLDQPTTLAAAMDGVERLFLLVPGIGL